MPTPHLRDMSFGVGLLQGVRADEETQVKVDRAAKLSEEFLTAP